MEISIKMRKRELKPEEITQQIREIYRNRKTLQGDTMKDLADEIGISHTRLHDSISGKFTSGKTLRSLREYLNKLKPVTGGAQK